MEEQDHSKYEDDLQCLSHTHTELPLPRIPTTNVYCPQNCHGTLSFSQATQISLVQCFIAKYIFWFLFHVLYFVMIPMPLVSISDVHIETPPSSRMNGHAKAKCRAWRTSPVLLLHCLPTQAHNCSQYGIEANVKMSIHHGPPVFFHTQCFPGSRFLHTVCD